ncbi:hypothetical protein M1D83_10620 [Enterobacteriaceae bacterium]
MHYFSAIRYFLVFFGQSDNAVMDYGIGKKAANNPALVGQYIFPAMNHLPEFTQAAVSAAWGYICSGCSAVIALDP